MTTDYDIVVKNTEEPSSVTSIPAWFYFNTTTSEGESLCFCLLNDMNAKLMFLVESGSVQVDEQNALGFKGKVLKIIHKPTLRQFTPQSFLEFIKSPI
jgi:hypothetical protein